MTPPGISVLFFGFEIENESQNLYMQIYPYDHGSIKQDAYHKDFLCTMCDEDASFILQSVLKMTASTRLILMIFTKSPENVFQ